MRSIWRQIQVDGRMTFEWWFRYVSVSIPIFIDTLFGSNTQLSRCRFMFREWNTCISETKIVYSANLNIVHHRKLWNSSKPLVRVDCYLIKWIIVEIIFHRSRFRISSAEYWILKMSPSKKTERKGAKASSRQTAHRRSTVKSATKVYRNLVEEPKAVVGFDSIPMPRTRRQHAIASCEIYRLNDHCLLDVFSYLPTIDLCAVKHTCRRFNALADVTVKKRFDTKYPFDPEKQFILQNATNYKDTTLILKHFGQFVKSAQIKFTSGSHLNKNMWLLLKHCTSLKRLDFFDENISSLPTYQMRRILRNLNYLAFHDKSDNGLNFGRIISACENLEYLSYFSSWTGDGAIPWLEENTLNIQSLRNLQFLAIGTSNNCRIAPFVNAIAENDSLNALFLDNVNADADLARAVRRITNLCFCVITTEFQMTETCRNAFEGFIDKGRIDGYYTYNFFA